MLALTPTGGRPGGAFRLDASTGGNHEQLHVEQYADAATAVPCTNCHKPLAQHKVTSEGVYCQSKKDDTKRNRVIILTVAVIVGIIWIVAANVHGSSPPLASSVSQSNGYTIDVASSNTPAQIQANTPPGGPSILPGELSEASGSDGSGNLEGVEVFSSSSDAATVASNDTANSVGTGLTVTQNGDVVTMSGPSYDWSSSTSSQVSPSNIYPTPNGQAPSVGGDPGPAPFTTVLAVSESTA